MRLIDADALNGYKFGLISPYAQNLFHKIINDAPTQKTACRMSEWIPVSERLPSDCGYDWVLAQIQETDTGYLWIPCVAEYRKGIDDWFSDANDIGWLRKHEGAFKVIAWMPLPESYTEESEIKE